MNDLDPRGPEGHGRDVLPAVDAALERLIAAMPLRRPSPALDARVEALFARPEIPWWRRVAPIAAAAGFALAVGFIAGTWSSQLRLGRPGSDDGVPGHASSGLNLVHQESSARPAAFAAPRTMDLGDGGSVQTAPSVWIRTDRFRDPTRGVTIERSYPETWTLVGTPSTN